MQKLGQTMSKAPKTSFSFQDSLVNAGIVLRYFKSIKAIPLLPALSCEGIPLETQQCGCWVVPLFLERKTEGERDLCKQGEAICLLNFKYTHISDTECQGSSPKEHQNHLHIIQFFFFIRPENMSVYEY